MAFSSALVLTDLNDYIAPSQACIKPVEIKKSENSGPVQTRFSHSGCVTSAESVLISMQSQEELYGILKTNLTDPGKHRTVVVSISPQSRASIAAKYNMTPLSVHQRLVSFFKHHLGVHHVFDTSFSRDLALVEAAREFVERFRLYMANGGDKIEASFQQQFEMEQQQQQQQQQQTPDRRARRRKAGTEISGNQQQQQHIPMLASSCPGWVCYAEKTHGAVIPHIATAKSPQQMMGSLIKDYLAKKTDTPPNAIYHVAIMPCYDKKLEASRPDFFLEEFDTREVDCVLTTGEVEKMFQEQGIDFHHVPEAQVDDMFNKMAIDPVSHVTALYGTSGSSSGGFLEYIMATAARELYGIQDVPADPLRDNNNGRMGKNADVREYFLLADDGRVLLRFATAFGFRNIQNIVRKIKTGKCSYHYVEVMACPGGCANGGGQLANPNAEEVMSAKDWLNRVENIYQSVPGVAPEQNEMIKTIYREWIGDDPTSDRAKRLLRTQYHAVTQHLANPLATKW
ncbi:iron hydrogenase [Dichotomocladium elegans]|nr:iron hydrogenase [Dichotomocladium elegans]